METARIDALLDPAVFQSPSIHKFDNEFDGTSSELFNEMRK